MTTQHHDGLEKNEKEISIEPIVLNSVKIREIEKTVEVPNFVSVDVERPNYIDKDFERPVITDKKYERPIVTDVPCEKPVVTIKETEYEKPIIVDKEYERPILIDKEYERPVIVENKYTVPVPHEVPYDVPIIAMEKVNQIASEAVLTLNTAKDMLEEVNAIIGAFRTVTDEINDTMKEVRVRLSEVKNYKIVEEKYKVSVPNYIKEDIRIKGKVVSIGDA